jgi:tetratricopeptide (TPR) repeat protein
VGGPAGRREGGQSGDFVEQLMKAQTLFDAGKRDEAVPFFQRAKALFPEYAGENSPYWYLALIYKEKGSLRQAADELAKLTAINEDHYAANLEHADLLEKLGDHAGAAAALERAIYIFPYEIPIHTRLAELYRRLGTKEKAIRERRAVVALEPVDKAEAHYQLAVAYHEAGDRQSARRSVLRALEEAPSFEKAQELLLTLQGEADHPERSVDRSSPRE